MCLFCPKCGFFCPQTLEMPFSVPFSSVKKASEKSADFSEAQIKNNFSSYIAVRAVRTRYSMACTGYCPAAVSPVSIRLDAPSSTAL